MTKQEQFLWIVQTAFLTNAINLCSAPERADKYKLEHNASGALMLADEAIDASERIPEDMTAYEAANEFCSFMFKNLRDSESQASGKKMTVPSWFARS